MRRDFDTTESALVKALFPMHGAAFCKKYMPERTLRSISLYAHRNGIRRDIPSLMNERRAHIPKMNQARVWRLNV
jgi:hypothetical protein